MTQTSPEEVTGLLVAWSDGDQAALEKLTPLVYAELHRLAKRYMRREHARHTLQTSALVNEAYLHLIDARGVRWQNRAHFFAVSAQIMRRILVDFARARQNLKRGGGARQVALDEGLVISPERGADLLALDEALARLAVLNARQSRSKLLSSITRRSSCGRRSGRLFSIGLAVMTKTCVEKWSRYLRPKLGPEVFLLWLR
jgi:RNA polymerase sigma-70 factor, ECF subfamily